jgi:hypothetical protein
MVGQWAVTPWLRQVGSIPTSSTKYSQMRELVKSASLERSAFERAQGFESLSDCQLIEGWVSG